MRGRLPGRGAREAGAARRFGPASLTVQGAPQPSVQVNTNTYDCPPPQDGTCWGSISGSGLPAGACCVVVTAPLTGGNTGQGTEIDIRVDQNGNIGGALNLDCFNDYHVYYGSLHVDATQVGAGSADYDSPGCS